MLKAGFISLGCAKNLVDTEVMLGTLAANAIEITANPDQADVIIVNTCSFIDSAKEESINAILQMAEYKKQHNCRALIVAGCLGQRYRQDLLEELPEVDAIIGTNAWHRIMEAVNAALAGERVLIVGDTETIYDETMPRIATTPTYTSYIKVAEGCNNRCSYCVIPMVRGNYRSRPVQSIVAEVKNLAVQGIKEINLIAQDTTSYGSDLYGTPRLTELLKELVTIDGVEWIRLLYCYPKYFSDELIELIANQPKICKYIDMPLQHAHDDILKAMYRRDSRRTIEELLNKLRSSIPGVAIRTSFIVGFPGETEEHYQALKEFVREQRFDKVGVFTYSREEDTPAFALANQVDDDVKQQRYHDLMALQCQISEELNQSLEGRTFEILVEGRDPEQPNLAFGRSYREALDIDGQIFIENDADSKPGEIIRAKIIQGFTYDLLAEKATS
ncbi:30S ribosomal protein S12 methylthiotransferase RimO|uniref:Ribosomal protein uS12 methylthiotransferase RimO n=1 Tax=Dendrosporobacter quercicolus TaxID=146817 RepID=A0A1G9LNZ0_9FIRM|nr:30S ribosomal protein S12 methylthiotransferase RimO [Dendrosporobacter quercicolus]NSL46777.1 30S ribosomal protein S12 methylthiotransferase RimO [Dendrosporobacter quercicolus DSM 1736]SDL63603.1 ribosomal protein S12 methylthiotransferase [Dendrosporobacter quercicolus]